MVQILPQEPTLGQLLGAGVGAGLQSGLSNVIETSVKHKADVARGNALSNALLRMNGVEPASNSPLNEPAGVSDYGEIGKLSNEDIFKLENIRRQRESTDIARQKMALQDTKKFREGVKEGAESAKRLLKSVQNQQHILRKGLKTGPFTWDALMFRMGLKGAASPAAQAFQANLLDYMEGQREKFGVRLTDADLRLILDKLPDISRSKEGNELILSLFESQAKYETLKKKALSDVMKEGVTLDLEERFDNHFEKLLSENPTIENGFRDSVDKLYEEAKKPTAKRGQRMAVVIAPDGTERRMPYSKDLARRVKQFGGRIKRGAI